MGILSKLKLARTPKDLGQTMAEINADIARVEEEIKLLEQSRERVLFEEGEDAVSKLQKDLVAKRDYLEILLIGRRGTLERQAIAEAAERQRHLEAVAGKAGKDLLPPLQSALREYHAAASKLVDAAKKAAGLDAEVRRLNEFLKQNDRPDLQLPLPYGAAFATFKKAAFDSGHLALSSEKWTEIAKREGIDNLPPEAFPSLMFVNAPSLQSITVPGYMERGNERWEQYYRYF